MRLSLLCVPAVFALAASVGCHNAQRVKYDVQGNAVAVEDPKYEPPANNTQAPVQVMPDPTPVAPPAQPTPTVQPQPQPQPAPADGSAQSDQPQKPDHHHNHDKAAKGTYIVQKGDTLQKISEKAYGTTKKWHLIMKANKLPDDKIHVGQKLILPEVSK